MRVDAQKESFEEVTVFGHPMLFTSMRIDPATVPDGLHHYSVRHDDEGEGIPVEICRWVMVNHWGDLITNVPVRFDLIPYISNNGYRALKEDDFIYTGSTATLDEYIQKNPAGEHAKL